MTVNASVVALSHEAERLDNRSLDAFIANILSMRVQRKTSDKQKEEAILLQKINKSLSIEQITRFRALNEKRLDDNINEQEYLELGVLIEKIEKGLEEMDLPPMMLQTLVENAVKHGVERSMVLCKINIDATRHGESVVLRVANQGQLRLTSTSTQIGLSNTSRRLALLFGTNASCTMMEENGWVVARIVLPGNLT